MLKIYDDLLFVGTLLALEEDGGEATPPRPKGQVQDCLSVRLARQVMLTAPKFRGHLKG